MENQYYVNQICFKFKLYVIKIKYIIRDICKLEDIKIENDEDVFY